MQLADDIRSLLEISGHWRENVKMHRRCEATLNHCILDIHDVVFHTETPEKDRKLPSVLDLNKPGRKFYLFRVIAYQRLRCKNLSHSTNL